LALERDEGAAEDLVEGLEVNSRMEDAGGDAFGGFAFF
jgi:hypothetical protein